MTSRLLDTDVCIAVLRGEVGAETRLRAMTDLAISTVTAAELTYGAQRSRDPARDTEEVRRFIGALDVLPLDLDAAERSGYVRAALAAAGTPVGGYDLLIAGVALSRDLTLVTGNVREFRRVPDLRLEEW